MPIPLEQDTPSTAEQRREICALISATREAISGLGDSIQPLDRYLADVADALAETDGETREAKLEQFSETHKLIKDTIDLSNEQSTSELKTKILVI